MWKILVLLVLSILSVSAGCVRTYYVKPGRSQADFQVDRQDCKVEAAPIYALGFQGFQVEPHIVEGMVKACLIRQGWREATPEENERIEKSGS